MRPTRLLAAFAGTWAVLVLSSGTASAVQTDEFGLAAHTGTALVFTADGERATEQVRVYNRTDAPLTVTLDVVDAWRNPAGVFSYGAAEEGLAEHVSVAERTVRLGPRESRTVPVTVDAPASSEQAHAAVTAVAGDDTVHGALAVRSRLAVIIQMDPVPAGHPALSQGLAPIGLGAGVVALGMATAARRYTRHRGWHRPAKRAPAAPDPP